MTRHETSASGSAPTPEVRPPGVPALSGLEQLLSLTPGQYPPAHDAPVVPRSRTRRRARTSRSAPSPADPHGGARTGQSETVPEGAGAQPESAAVEANMLRLFTADQAALLLQIPASWLRKKAAAGLIAHTRIGRHLRFSPADLKSLIETGQRAPHDPSR